MKYPQWLSLNLDPDGFSAYNNGHIRTVEVIEKDVVGLPRKGALPAHAQKRIFGKGNSVEEAHVIATMLRVMNPV